MQHCFEKISIRVINGRKSLNPFLSSSPLACNRNRTFFNWSSKKIEDTNILQRSPVKSDKENQIWSSLAVVKDPVTGFSLGSIGAIQYVRFLDDALTEAAIELDLLVLSSRMIFCITTPKSL